MPFDNTKTIAGKGVDWVALLCWAALILNGSVWAAGVAPDPDRRLVDHARDHWSIDQGLPQNSVMALAQDPKGYIWVGTFEGLARFDGVRFTRYLPSDHAGLRRGTTILHFDPDGTMWVGTQNDGLFRVSVDGGVRHFTEVDGLARNIVWSIARDPTRSTLWVGTAGGLCQLQGETFSCLSSKDGIPSAPVADVLWGDDGSMWVGTGGYGLYRIHEGESQNWREVDGLPMLRIRDLEFDHQGNLWIASFGAGLVLFDGNQFRVRKVVAEPGDALINAVMADGSGSIWVGAYGSGLHRMTDGRLQSLGHSAGYSNTHVQSLLADREGSLWFGTSGGLNRIRNVSFVTWSVEEGLSGPFIRSVTEDVMGDIWVGTDSRGVNRIRDGRVVAVYTQPDLLSNSVRALWPGADGSVWLGAYGGGVSRIRPDGSIVNFSLEDGLTSNLVRVVMEDSRGHVWIGSDRRGITRLTPFGVIPLTESDGLPSDDVRAIVEAPDGSIWIGTYGSGLARYANEKLTALDFLPDGIIFAIRFEPDGSAWIGAEDGLFRYTPNGVAQLAGKDGLDGAIFQILDDQLGHLWICTNRGVISIEKAALLAPAAQPSLRFYGIADGLRSRQCNGASQPAGWRAHDGRLWFPTSKGVSRVDPGDLVQNPLPPPIVIESARVNDEQHPLSADGGLDIPAGAQRTEINYTALSFIASDMIVFRYRLEGYDDRWVEAGSRRMAFYGDLPPGRYRFEVTAANSDGVWNPTGSHLDVIQRPFLHETLGFRVAFMVLLASLVVWVIHRRASVLRRENARLEATVEDRTRHLETANRDLQDTLEELRTTQRHLIEAEKLAALGSLVAGVAHEVNTPVGNGLTIASHLAERCQHLEDSVTTENGRSELDAFRGALGMLTTNLERAGRIISSFKRIAINKDRAERRRFQLSTVLSDARLGVVQQIQSRGHRLVVECPDDVELDSYPEALYELLTHLVANSLDHAFDGEGGTIRIVVSTQGDFLELVYSDDGRGIDESTQQRLFEPFSTGQRGKHPGLGLHIVYNIATRLLGGRIRIEQGPGAVFVVEIPVTAPQ